MWRNLSPRTYIYVFFNLGRKKAKEEIEKHKALEAKLAPPTSQPVAKESEPQLSTDTAAAGTAEATATITPSPTTAPTNTASSTSTASPTASTNTTPASTAPTNTAPSTGTASPINTASTSTTPASTAATTEAPNIAPAKTSSAQKKQKKHIEKEDKVKTAKSTTKASKHSAPQDEEIAALEPSKKLAKTDTSKKSNLAPDTAQSSNAEASSSKPANPAESTEKQDITGLFGPENSSTAEASASTKTQFLNASLVVPGIALKKFKMAMAANTTDARSFIAVFGEATVKMHKAVRPTLEGMVIGNLTRHQQTFWAAATKQLKTKTMAAILQPSDSPTSIEAASWQGGLGDG